jgi:hypothetical protein
VHIDDTPAALRFSSWLTRQARLSTEAEATADGRYGMEDLKPDL